MIKKLAQILHTRLRLGCISLNADSFSNRISDTDKYSCGLIETAEHCPYYLPVRRETMLNVAINAMYVEQVNGEIFSTV